MKHALENPDPGGKSQLDQRAAARLRLQVQVLRKVYRTIFTAGAWVRSSGSVKMNHLARLIVLALLGTSVYVSYAATDTSIRNQALTVSVRVSDAAFSVYAKGLEQPVLTSRIGAEVDKKWLSSSDYPRHQVVESAMSGELGSGHRIEVTFSGLKNEPDLSYSVDLYDGLPFGDVQVLLRNSGTSSFMVQDIRVMDMVGDPQIYLGGAASSDRVLSDSFSEDRPPLQIFDLGKAREYKGGDRYSKNLTNVHFAAGSQLVYNRTSGVSLFLGALSADKWLTLYHLNTATAGSGNVNISSYVVDCTGTTEVEKRESLRGDRPEQQVELSLPLDPGKQLISEKVMFAAGRDYHSQLDVYGSTIRQLRHALVSKPGPWGWWSWTAYYFGLSEGTALTNAEWLAQHLRSYGFDLFHIDDGYQYAYGEYATPNAIRFPDGIGTLGYHVSEMGLKFGVWTGPFRVSARAWVYEKHPEWLVHDLNGAPIQTGYVTGSHEPLFVLDSTNPGAQEYLRKTYQTLVHKWNVRYIKLDFMDDTAIEGHYYRPNTSAVEAQQIGLKVIRDAVGPDILLDKDGSMMLPAVGYTDLGRTSADTGHSFEATREDATGIAARYYMNGNFYGADPDAFTVSKELLTDHWHSSKAPLKINEAEVSIALAAAAGGMFEIGDDLPTLGTQAERLKLITNKDLLDMVRLGRAMTPVDLMTYLPEDEQPSIFLLKEDNRQTMLAVFNWTESERSHKLSLQAIGYVAKGAVAGTDAFHPDRKVELADGILRIDNQEPHSVRLIKLVNTSISAQAPSVEIRGPETTQICQNVEFRAAQTSFGTPATQYHWDFGDGTTAEGAATHHAYTRDGAYVVKLKVSGIDGKSAFHSAGIRVLGTLTTTYDPQDYSRFVDGKVAVGSQEK